MFLPHEAAGSYAVCDRGTSLSYSLAFSILGTSCSSKILCQFFYIFVGILSCSEDSSII